jgi:hypothetical protein
VTRAIIAAVVVLAAGAFAAEARPREDCGEFGRPAHRSVTLCAADGSTRRVRVRPPFEHGGWRWGALSPDGKTILAEWSGECEIPMAFFAPGSGGKPRSVSGPYTRRRPPPNSQALGWTKGGRAIVFAPAEPGCGGEDRPGVFLVTTGGRWTRLADVRPHARSPIRRSSIPRTVAQIKRAL